ncbi:MAG: Leucyl-tRNA synthetase, mitochondrial [Sclerophora amabilis]|nr:MAG: Leucyl-tRNA synthetase, mitochondrial [Sclerophora amabilis]
MRILRSNSGIPGLRGIDKSRSFASTHTTPPLDLQLIEAKWHLRWAADAAPTSSPPREAKTKFYVLPMFPYPSGTLHIGHLRVYTISDVLARFRRMQGFNVIHPMGWDAFGLPAENAAIERGIDPRVWTLQNIGKMKAQIIAMGGSWDWNREFMTCDPHFYKHTQRIFLLLHEHGLAYQADSLVNYDPVDRTVLANEQVDANGCSWRSGAKVEKRYLKQWFLRITAFKEALRDNLDVLSKEGRWPEHVISMQRNWLDSSKGARIKFSIVGSEELEGGVIETFTTRPDTLFGVQYLALSIRHPAVARLAQSSSALQEFIDQAVNLPQDSKVGYLLPNVSGRNPLSLLKDRTVANKGDIPIYVAPYVLDDYGEGAVMGVPGHDARDHAFWKANRGDEEIRYVVKPGELQAPNSDPEIDELFTGQGVLRANCGDFAGQSSLSASEGIVHRLQTKGNLASTTEIWRLRDWLISRQRYWGTPIPMVHCNSCGAVPVPPDELPVELPQLNGDQFRGKGNPLEGLEDWVNTKCPSCGSAAKRDTDTMDTFVDSSWYYMRFADPHNTSAPFSTEAAKALLPVDIYVGGVEHSILHLLYARFISKFLATVSFGSAEKGPGVRSEPFQRLITQGMVHGKTYSDPCTGRFLRPEEVDLSRNSSPLIKATGKVPSISWEKMSKSKHNGVDPETCTAKYGADATRAHMLFQAPVSEVLEWDEDRIVGIQRWLRRVWRLVHSAPRATFSNPPPLPPVAELSPTEYQTWTQVEDTIKAVTTSYSATYSLNTVVSDITKLTNALSSLTQEGSSSLNTTLRPSVEYHTISVLLRLLAPITPAFAEECWEVIHTIRGREDTSTNPRKNGSIFDAQFPIPSASHIARTPSTQICAVQVNGKLKFTTEVPRFSSSPSSTPSTSSPFSSERQGTEDEERERRLVAAIVSTEDGKRLLGRAQRYDAERARRVIVVQGGKVVNFVF